MRVITLNVNGIRSAERRGFARWLARAEPWDVVCLQELRAHHDDVPKSLRAPRKCTAAFHPAQRKGYAGVGVYARAPAQFANGFGSREFDGEGRYLRADFRDVTVISLYLPSGSSGPHRQASKFRFLAEFLPHLAQLRQQQREIILCGDWNIAHQPIDLKNWRSNQKNSGFLPEERAWLTRVFDDLGFVDVFRKVDPRAGAVHVVVQSRRSVGEQRGLAHRLSDRHAGDRRQGARGRDLQEPALQRPRSVDHRLRLRTSVNRR